MVGGERENDFKSRGCVCLLWLSQAFKHNNTCDYLVVRNIHDLNPVKAQIAALQARHQTINDRTLKLGRVSAGRRLFKDFEAGQDTLVRHGHLWLELAITVGLGGIIIIRSRE